MHYPIFRSAGLFSSLCFLNLAKNASRMVRQIILAQCGIQFDQAALKEMDIPLPTLSFGRIDPNAIFR